MIVVDGAGSAIVAALKPLLPPSEVVHPLGMGEDVPGAERYLFCRGMMRPTPILQQAQVEVAETFFVNAARTIAICDGLIAANSRARICVIGSESGYEWSFDGAYAAAKAALHRYVETKRLAHPGQQLVAVAPGIIADAGMTLRRTDRERVEARAIAHPKGRHLTSAEVARLVHHVLYVDEGWLSGVVIRMNGGAHTCR